MDGLDLVLEEIRKKYPTVEVDDDGKLSVDGERVGVVFNEIDKIRAIKADDCYPVTSGIRVIDEVVALVEIEIEYHRSGVSYQEFWKKWTQIK